MKIFVPEKKFLNEITFTGLDVFIKLQKLKEDKVCGPDGIHPKILKDCVETLAKPLFLVFTESWSSSIVPLDWKLANISPIYKKGSQSMASNYRPVSLTCLASKLILCEGCNVKTFIRKQFKYPRPTKSFSCLTNLLETFESWTDVDQGHSADVNVLDFQKAFDKVPKKKLLQKLSAHGI